ncbi:MAG: DUF4062 domain-containing protein [Cyclobacteriaceae bacterium]
MKKVFVSSVMNNFEEYRTATREAIEIMDLKPIMAEDFGARAYSSETACIKEAQESDLFIVVLGKKYGFVMDDGLSVTHSEYRAAQQANRPTLTFIQQCTMEPEQERFKTEVESYHDGFFRGSFSSPNELKDQVIKSLRQYEKEGMAAGDDAFNKRIDTALQETSTHSQNEPRGVVAFWGQPTSATDLDYVEKSADALFQQLCSVGAANMRTGYKINTKSNRVEIESEKTKLVLYDDGLKIIYFSAEPANDSSISFAMFHVSPGMFQDIALRCFDLCDTKIVWSLVGLLGMESRYFAEPEKGNSSSVPMYNQPSELVVKFLSPITIASYGDWVRSQVKKFQRIYSKK